MSQSSVEYLEDRSELDELKSASAEALATLEPVETTEVETGAAEWAGPCCEKCAAPMKSGVVTICRSCGWYSSLGICVEVDPNWETAVNDPQPAAAPQPTSHIGYWLKLIPWWGWVIIASVLAVILESVAVRLSTPFDSSLRTAWSLTQLAVGF